MAKKKIYDIKPPKVAAANKAEAIKKEPAVKKTRVARSQPKRETPVATPAAVVARHEDVSRPASFLPISIGVGALVIIIVGVYLFFKLPKVDITIWPKVQTLSFTQKITADKKASTVDDVADLVPAQYFESTKTISQDFPATGYASDAGKASGTITVYNKIDPPDAISLRAGTRFMSDSGKIFVALDKISIPAARKSGSKVTPSSIQIRVEAMEGGDSYNISSSNFSIPALKGTALYYGVYGESKQAMSGGTSGKIKKVTSDDISGAKDALSKKAEEDATADLRSQLPSDFILLDDAVSSDVVNATTQTKSGTVADKFTYTVTAKATVLAFKKSDVEGFAKRYVSSHAPDGQTVLEKDFKIDYAVNSADTSSGKMSLNLSFSSGAYQNIDQNSLALSLTGKSADQINQTISGNLEDQISKVKVSLWPFWVTKSPNNQKAVNIKLKFE
jgi:hypothetical protein